MDGKKESLWNEALEIKVDLAVESVGEAAVITRGFDLPIDDSNTYRQLAGKDANQSSRPNKSQNPTLSTKRESHR